MKTIHHPKVSVELIHCQAHIATDVHGGGGVQVLLQYMLLGKPLNECASSVKAAKY